MEFRVLGPVEGVLDGRVIRLDSPTQRALLALFVIHAGRTLSPDRILAEVWPQDAPASGVKTLRYHISKLRDVLHDGGATVLHTVQGGYVLDAAAEDIDSIRFERLVDEARTSFQERPDRASRLLRDALSLWRGEAFGDVADHPFVSIEAMRLENLRLDAVEERIEADLTCGRHAEVVAELEKLTAMHPLRERLFGQLMIAQYRLGRQADALRTCQRLRRTLSEELGIDPGLDIRQLEERILVHDPSLVVVPSGSEDRAGRAAVMTSVVVLPFQHVGPHDEDRFFADGLTEDLIYALARVEGLRVISRTSAFALREQVSDVREIGRQLRAEAVVDGSVRRAGERIRITAELVDVADGYQLWTGRYDRERQDIFAIQEEVAQAIASALKSKLDRRPVIAVPRHTASMDAYDAFLQGRYHWHQQTAEGFRQAAELFQRAVTMDPGFGKAVAWLAIVRTYSTIFGYLPPDEVFPAAKEEAHRAIALEPNLTEAHLTLGLIAQYADWDWEATEHHYRRAIELSPGNAQARSWFGLLLARLGREDEAVAQAAAALDLDPLAHESSWLYLVVLTHLGRHAEAAALGHKAAKVHPRSAHIHWPTSVAHLGLGEPELALERIRRAVECDPTSPYARAFLVRALTATGDMAEATAEADRMLEEKRNGYFSPFILAVARMGLDDVDETVGMLEEALAVADPMMPFINYWGLSPVADDPRYQAILDKVDLPNLFAGGRREP
jgi:TolB-like protein/DNA-binding winged helix-turn-helix (wHTH) protein/Flp pilus assembly protein TadD